MIKYLVMDIDGSLTDGKVYMGQFGEMMKAFSIKDGYVFNFILKPNGIIPIVITARSSDIVLNRCKELDIKNVYQGKLNKLEALEEIVGVEKLGECAYFGDDILDLDCIRPIKMAGGVAGCPADAVKQVRENVDYVCESNAGDGALREFVEWLVTNGKEANAKEAIHLENRIKSALDYLLDIDVYAIEIGKKYKVDETFFYSIQTYVTKDEKKCDFESHKQHVDIQIILEGKEAIDVADISRLTIKEAYNSDLDRAIWNTPIRSSRMTLTKGNYIILYPENAHKGAISVERKEKVIKLIGKVLVD